MRLVKNHGPVMFQKRPNIPSRKVENCCRCYDFVFGAPALSPLMKEIRYRCKIGYFRALRRRVEKTILFWNWKQCIWTFKLKRRYIYRYDTTLGLLLWAIMNLQPTVSKHLHILTRPSHHSTIRYTVLSTCHYYLCILTTLVPSRIKKRNLHIMIHFKDK